MSNLWPLSLFFGFNSLYSISRSNNVVSSEQQRPNKLQEDYYPACVLFMQMLTQREGPFPHRNVLIEATVDAHLIYSL